MEQFLKYAVQRAPELAIIAGMLWITLKSMSRVVDQLVKTGDNIQQLHRDTLEIVQQNSAALTAHNNNAAARHKENVAKLDELICGVRTLTNTIQTNGKWVGTSPSQNS